MEQIYGRLLIFDGSHALHRSLSEPHLWEMRNLQGQRTGGVYGVLQTILKESTTYNYFPVVVFDGRLSERRLQIHPNYKKFQERQMLNESMEQLTEEQLLEQEHRREYNTQREILKELLPAFGIPVIHLEDWEGDDIIYILTKLSKDSIVVSDDKDLLQLICEDSERRCRVRRGMRDEFWDLNTLKEQNINQREFVAHKAIVGDASDNIPSACFQVGEKTAPGLYKLYTESVKMPGGFPTTEEELTNKCKTIGIPKRKAYLNFNEAQFLNNVLLMDLSLVDNDINTEVISKIENTIINNWGKRDVNTVTTILENLNIKSFVVNNLIDNINRTQDFISEKYNFLNVPDIIKPKFGGLF